MFPGSPQGNLYTHKHALILFSVKYIAVLYYGTHENAFSIISGKDNGSKQSIFDAVDYRWNFGSHDFIITC